MQVLRWLGAQGTRAVAALVVLGVALPPLGELLRPYVTEAIFVLLCISFMRVDVAALRAQLRRPGIVLAATLWTHIWRALDCGPGLPCDRIRCAFAGSVSGIDAASSGRADDGGAGAGSPDGTGFDPLVLITLVTSISLIPISAPLFAYVFFGAAADAPRRSGLA